MVQRYCVEQFPHELASYNQHRLLAAIHLQRVPLHPKSWEGGTYRGTVRIPAFVNSHCGFNDAQLLKLIWASIVLVFVYFLVRLTRSDARSEFASQLAHRSMGSLLQLH